MPSIQPTSPSIIQSNSQSSSKISTASNGFLNKLESSNTPSPLGAGDPKSMRAGTSSNRL